MVAGVGGRSARDTTVTGLTNGQRYEFAVRAVNGVGDGASVSTTATPKRSSVVSFESASYEATEGGAGVSIGVSLSPVVSQAVRIPVVVSADAGTESGDYAVGGLTDGTVWLSFAAGVSSQSFTITAHEDADSADETVTVSFGSLPSGVSAVGTTRQATVTLRDNDEDTEPMFDPSSGSEAAIVGVDFNFPRPDAEEGNAPLSYSVISTCTDFTVTSSSVRGTPSSTGQCGITWTVTDADGDTDTYTLQISVAADTEPMFDPSSGSEAAIVGVDFNFPRPDAEEGNAPLSYSVSSTCTDLTVTDSSVRGTPSSTGQCGITWTVTDADGDTDTYALQISVAADTEPMFDPSSGSEAAIVGVDFNFPRPDAEEGNAPLSYSVISTCTDLTVTDSSVRGTPSSTGQCGITWTVTDADGDTDTYTLQISVYADTEPVFDPSSGSEAAIVGVDFNFPRPDAEEGNAPLSYSVISTCTDLTVTDSSVRGTPSSTGQCGITWTVTDADGDTDTYALQISVAADTSPSFPSSGTSKSAIKGHSFSFSRPSASGGNAPLTYSVSGSCSGLTVTSSSVRGTPSSTGQCGISWTVTDADGDTDTYALQISVAADTEPMFDPSSGSEAAIVGVDFSFSRPSASDGNTPLSYSVISTCTDLTVTDSSVRGTPSSTGQCGITWTVTDADGDTDTYTLQISVAADTEPMFDPSSGSEAAIVGVDFNFPRPDAEEGNAPLSYSVISTCTDLTVTDSSVRGTPSSTGQCGITWTVTDADGDTDTYALQISVAADTEPMFDPSSGSEAAIVGVDFNFSRPSASGGNTPLSYSVISTCTDLTVTDSSVRGTPSSTGQCGITWTVTDADGDTDTYALQISVAADTSPSFPSSGTSRSAIKGHSFSFSRPSASGGNAPLTYSVSGSCSGLTVTSSSVSGTPSSTGQCGITLDGHRRRWRHGYLCTANLRRCGHIAFVFVVGHVSVGDQRPLVQFQSSFGQWGQRAVDATRSAARVRA